MLSRIRFTVLLPLLKFNIFAVVVAISHPKNCIHSLISFASRSSIQEITLRKTSTHNEITHPNCRSYLANEFSSTRTELVSMVTPYTQSITSSYGGRLFRWMH